MIFVLNIILALLLTFLPSILALVCSRKEFSTIFLLNICWLLASFVLPLNFSDMNWMGWVGNIICLISFIMLLPEDKTVDTKL